MLRSLSILLMSIVFAGFLMLACEAGRSREARQSQGEPPPKLRKIPVESREQAEQLMQNGIEVIVIEESYVIARLRNDDQNTVQSAGLQTQPFAEDELIQRLVKIPVPDRSRIQPLVDLGLDVWEIRGDTLIAQVFDKHILAARALGYEVEVAAENVLDLVAQPGEE